MMSQSKVVLNLKMLAMGEVFVSMFVMLTGKAAFVLTPMCLVLAALLYFMAKKVETV